MDEPFIGEIRAFALNFAPAGWMACDGQTLTIQQYQALFSILGITFGGNGSTNFCLPNLQDRAPMCAGNAPGLTPRTLGQEVGEATVALDARHYPPHTHALKVNATDNADKALAAGGFFAKTGYRSRSKFVAINAYRPVTSSGTVQMSSRAITESGQTGPIAHDNMQPYLPLLLCIAVTGIYPSPA